MSDLVKFRQLVDNPNVVQLGCWNNLFAVENRSMPFRDLKVATSTVYQVPAGFDLHILCVEWFLYHKLSSPTAVIESMIYHSTGALAATGDTAPAGNTAVSEMGSSNYGFRRVIGCKFTIQTANQNQRNLQFPPMLTIVPATKYPNSKTNITVASADAELYTRLLGKLVAV